MDRSNPDYKKVKQLLTEYYQKQEISSDDFERKEVWDSIVEGIGLRRRKRIRRIFSSVAAAAAIVLGLFFINHNGGEKEDYSAIVSQMSSDRAVSKEIRLVTSSDKEIRVDKGATVAYSQNGLTINDETVLSEEPLQEGAFDKIIVPKGRYSRLILSDGSSMYINAGTTVMYPVNFKTGQREIFVDGEVYLDVVHDENAPFIVKTKNFDVRVLGTSFDVNAYNDDPDNQEVILAEGKVNVRTRSGQEVNLSPDRKAVVSSKGEVSESNVNAREYAFWTQGILYLNIAPVKDILLKLSRYYGTTITCGADIAEVEIVGKVDLECGVWEALNRIADAGRFNLFKTTDGYELKAR